MELPFYYSYHEFQNNYKKDLDNWLHKYPDADEKDFLLEIKNLYLSYFGEDYKEIESIRVVNDDDVIINEISFESLGYILQRFFNKQEYGKDIPSIINNIEMTLKYGVPYIEVGKLLIDDNFFQTWKPFLLITESAWSKIDDKKIDLVVTFDYVKFKNFKYSITKIIDFADAKLANTPLIKLSTENNIIEDVSSEEYSNIDAKVKFILLKEIGVIDYLQKENYNNADIAKILNLVTGINTTYIQNILTADGKDPNHISEKSAYKKKNINRAITLLNDIDIELEQCKYLPKLKNDNPELFE